VFVFLGVAFVASVGMPLADARLGVLLDGDAAVLLRKNELKEIN
jgi:hypothetical protein